MTATKNKENSAWAMIKLGLILACYAVASCTVLALVNNVTAPVIQKNNEEKAAKAMRAVFAQAESFNMLSSERAGLLNVDSIGLALVEGRVAGAVAQVSGPTYDKATIMVGMTKDGTVTGVSFLANTDSPGFGLKASDPTFTLKSGKTFYGQFEGLQAKDGFVLNQNVDAISGATITSRGVAALVERACVAMEKALKEAE